MANQLLLNKSNTELLNILSHLDNFPNIMIDGELIKNSQSIIYLEIIIGSELTLNGQIKAKYVLYKINYIRQFLTKSISIMLLKSLALTHFDYCCSKNNDLSKVEMQNISRCIRLCVSTVYRNTNLILQV